MCDILPCIVVKGHKPIKKTTCYQGKVTVMNLRHISLDDSVMHFVQLMWLCSLYLAILLECPIARPFF